MTISILRTEWSFICKKLEPLLHKDALCQAGWNWPSGAREKNYFVIVFSLFQNYLPLEKDVAIHLNKQEFPSPMAALYQVWLKLAEFFWRRRYFEIMLSLYFRYLVIISPWNKAWPFIWTNLNSLQPRNLCAKFGWN